MQRPPVSALALLLFAAAAPLAADEKPRPALELVSQRGRRSEVKKYHGEKLVFRVREAGSGVAGIFEPKHLSGVTFRLLDWPRRVHRATAIADGFQRKVRTLRTGDDAPSVFDFTRTRRVGRYKLVAEKEGYEPDEVIVHLAYFDIRNFWHSCTPLDPEPEHYTAEFDLYLDDPGEEDRVLPVVVETLNSAGRVVDRREDVELRAVERWPSRFRGSRQVRVSTSEIEGFAARFARRAVDPLPGTFFDLQPLRAEWNGFLRISFRNVSFTWPIPFVKPGQVPGKNMPPKKGSPKKKAKKP